jgi:hypothetical protein
VTRSQLGRDRGSASLELVGLLPVVLLLGLLVVQAGVTMWTMTSTAEAAREAARASSLGADPYTAAEGSLPGALHVTSLSSVGAGHGIRLTVDVPRIFLLPHFTVSREAILP